MLCWDLMNFLKNNINLEISTEVENMESRKEKYYKKIKNILSLNPSKKKKHIKELASSYYELSVIYFDENKYDISLKYGYKSLIRYIRAEKMYKDSIIGISDALYTISVSYNRKLLYDMELKCDLRLLKVYKIITKGGNKDYILKTANLYYYMGIAAYNINNYFESEISYRKALAIFRRLNKQNNNKHILSFKDCLNSMAKVYSADKKYDEAEKCYIEELKICESLIEKDYENYTKQIYILYDELCSLCTDAKKYDKALEYSCKIIVTSKSLVNINSEKYLYRLGYSYNLKGNALYRLKKFNEAEKYYIKSEKIAEDLSKEDPHNQYRLQLLEDTSLKIGNIEFEYNDYNKAEKYYLISAKAFEKLIKDNFLKYACELGFIYLRIGYICYKKGIVNKAIYYQEKSVKVYEHFASESNNWYIYNLGCAYNYLAASYRTHNKYSLAEQCYSSAVRIFKHFLEEQRDINTINSVGNCLNNIATLMNDEYRYKEAKEYYLESLNLYKEIISMLNKSDEPDEQGLKNINTSIAGTYYNIAIMYGNGVVSDDEAEEYFIKSIKIYKKYHEKDPTCAIKLVKNYCFLGNFYFDRSRFEESKKCYALCIETLEKEPDKHSLYYKTITAYIYRELAEFYIKIDDLDCAEKSILFSISMYKELASDDPDSYMNQISSSLETAGRIYDLNDNDEKMIQYYTEAYKINEQLYKKFPDVYDTKFAQSMFNMGDICDCFDESDGAIYYYSEGVKIFEKTNCFNRAYINEKLIYAYHKLSVLYEQSGDIDKSQEFFEKADDLES